MNLDKTRILNIKIEKYRIAFLFICAISTIVLFSMAEENMYDYRKIILSFVAYILLSFISLDLSEVWYTICAELALIVSAIASFVVMELINFYTINWNVWRLFINALPFYILGKIFYLVSKSIKWSVATVLCSSYILSLMVYYVWVFRGQPILPWDIQAIGTAATVASTYEFYITKYMVYAFIICVLGTMCTFVIKRKSQKKIDWRYVISEILVIGLGIWLFIFSVYPKLWGNLWDMQVAYYDQGIIGGFVGHLQYCIVEEPSNYSKKQIESNILNVEKIQNDGVVAENIIVIMNESFSDLRVINDDIITDEYMPFIDSLNDNTIKGNLYVPIFGGNTCDSEFEVLLSASTLYTTPTPYQTTPLIDKESLVSYLEEREYYSVAFHPYVGKNWNRDTVYSGLGFEDYISLEDIGDIVINDPRTVRWCISDRVDYATVIEEYEEHNADKFFMFNVTMQNHGGYVGQYENFPNSVDLSNYGDYLEAETYLSLIKESDQAFKELVEYFSEVEEPTLICFFGDHLPSVGDEFYSLLYGKNVSELSMQERQKMYITPLVIWANYDIEEKYIDKISTNYLSLEILKAANIELEGYYSILNQIYERYSVLSKTGVIDVEGNYYSTSELTNDEMILQQQYLQYYRLYE